MKNIRMVLLILLVLVFVLSPASAKELDADQFWNIFRNAIIDNKVEIVISMTKFPFETRGPVDSDPIIKHNQKGFRKVYARILAQPVVMLSEKLLVTKSMYKVVEEKRHLSAKDYPLPEVIRIEQFQFQRIDGRWLFTRAYLEE